MYAPKMRQTGRMKNQKSYLDGFQLGKRISEKPRNNSSPRYQAGQLIRVVLFGSQTACINLFMPLLLSEEADSIIPLIPGCPADRNKDNCTKCNLMDITKEPQKCHYHTIGYKYWDTLKKNLDRFQGAIEIKGCPFRYGLNQLWRNQMLAFALQETGIYNKVTFSVCHHAKNTMLDKSINQYRALTNEDAMFNSFTNYDVLNAVNTHDSELQKWLQWYKELYLF